MTLLKYVKCLFTFQLYLNFCRKSFHTFVFVLRFIIKILQTRLQTGVRFVTTFCSLWLDEVWKLLAFILVLLGCHSYW